MAEQFSIPTVGDLIAGKYRVEEELGRGAYGVVFRADQEELGRHVAVKTLLPQAFLQQDIVQRFHREAQLISRLDHPNIIRLFDYGVDEGLLYMAVEYVEGRTLMDLIDNDAPLEPDRVRKISLQILDALVHAHATGIVHRDLKPENIVLLQTRTADGREYEVVKILDFGISKLLSGENDGSALKSLTQDGTVLGTPHYMSPENIVGDPIDHRADLYAFGIILCELLTGEHPFDAPSPSAVMVRHLRDDLPPLAEEIAHTPFGHAIRRCLEKQPWDRIGSATEVIEILEATDGAQIAQVQKRPSQELRGHGPTSPDETVVDAPDRRGLWFVLGVVLVALFVVAVGYAAYQSAVGVPGTDANAREPERPIPQPSVEPIPVKPAELAVAVPDLGHEPADLGNTGVAMVFPPQPDAAVEPPEPVKPPRPVEKVRTPAPRPDRDKDPRPRDSVPAEAATVEVQVVSVPSNANVTIDGIPVGATPLTHSLELEKPVQVRITHIGYKEKTVRLTPTPAMPPVRAELEKDHLRLVD